jgi:hypothetical protein
LALKPGVEFFVAGQPDPLLEFGRESGGRRFLEREMKVFP